jgi:hypothetical protein
VVDEFRTIELSNLATGDLTALIELAKTGGSHVIDMRGARVFPPTLILLLANAWRTTRQSRLAFVTQFETWAFVEDIYRYATDPLTDRGVDARLFYSEQLEAGHVRRWLVEPHASVTHEIAAVIATLQTSWQPANTWPSVVGMLARLIRLHASDKAPLLVDTASLAWACCGWSQAASVALEALELMDEQPTSLRSHALRILGAAKAGIGDVVAGTALIDEALVVATSIEDAAAQVRALACLGEVAFRERDLAAAAKSYQAAIALAHAEPPEVRAMLHHDLARALVTHGSVALATRHAELAYALLQSEASSRDESLGRLDGLLAAKPN